MSEIKFIEQICQRCGGELEEQNGGYVCKYCGKSWRSQSFSDFDDMLKACDEVSRRRRAEDIANLRRLLWAETHRQNVSNAEVARVSREILKYLPQDLYANFYLSTCDNRSVARFINTLNLSEIPDDDLSLMVNYLTDALKKQWFLPADTLVKSVKSASLRATLCDALEAKKRAVDNCVFEPRHHRGVFICYASEDISIVNRVVAALERENVECFVAARNLQHGSGAKDNYEREIHEALDNCDMLLFFSSADSRNLQRDCYKLEIDYVKRHNPSMPRLEYVITTYEQTRKVSDGDFNKFFKGHERCLTNDDAEVVRRVLDLLGQETARPEAERKISKPAQPEAEPVISKPVQPKPRKTASEADFNGKKMCANPDCGAMCDINIKFCPKCGKGVFFETYADYHKSLITYCDNCGAPNENGEKFCTSCGGSRFITYARLKEKEQAALKANEQSAAKAKQEAEAKAKQDAESKAQIANNFEIKNGVLVKYKGEDGVVTIPEGIKKIGKEAFSNCKSLTSVIIPNSVIFIGEDAFFNCVSLLSITVPNGVTYIGDRAFSFCESLKSIAIPSGVTSIGDGAFSFCESLKSIAIPSCVISIGNSAFENCDSLTSITIPNGVVSIGRGAFAFCESLSSVNLPCSLTSIDAEAFSDCKSLTSITIPNSMTDIAGGAFSNCKSLTSITIPNSVTSIYPQAFWGCESLTSITIPNSVTSIGYSTFGGCKSLKKIYCEAESKPSGWDEKWLGDCKAEVIWGYNKPKSASVKTDQKTNNFDVYYRGDHEFKYNRSHSDVFMIKDDVLLKYEGSDADVIIPDGVQKIGACAFECCEHTKSITIPDSVFYIESNAFRRCLKLTNINVGSGNISFKSIDGNLYSHDGKKLYRYAMGKTENDFIIPNNVNYIGRCAFWNCNNLTNVTIPDSVTIVQEKAFSDCCNLKNIYCNIKKPLVGLPKNWDNNWLEKSYKTKTKVIWNYKG